MRPGFNGQKRLGFQRVRGAFPAECPANGQPDGRARGYFRCCETGSQREMRMLKNSVADILALYRGAVHLRVHRGLPDGPHAVHRTCFIVTIRNASRGRGKDANTRLHRLLGDRKTQ
jgi:hypothetical protein